jgi:hypothetical protein
VRRAAVAAVFVLGYALGGAGVTLALLFWLLMVVTLLFGILWAWPRTPETRFAFGGALLWWVLLALLGWATFGPALRGV